MDLKELVRRYVQQRTVLLVDNRHFEAGKEFAAMRRQPSSEAVTNVVDALDFALKLINEKDAATPTPAANLQRFEPKTDGGGEWLIAIMTEDKDGEWVRYSDAMAEIERLKSQLDNTVLDASSLIEKVLHWAEVVRRNPDVSRDELLTMIADMEQHARLIYNLLAKVKP